MNGFARTLYAWLDAFFQTWSKRFFDAGVWCLAKAAHYRTLASKPKQGASPDGRR
ncbi:hypothetical protein LMIY3S_03669 [Labrys miyagiensis]